MSFAKWLRESMNERSETAYRLAKSIGVSQSTVANWLNAVSVPQIGHARSVADHFGCDVNDVLNLCKS